ncbi:MAG: hypothetical protein IJD60_11065 [Clostridia bacterium]|nr:hypothetical protein [Clostridia bacterium]
MAMLLSYGMHNAGGTQKCEAAGRQNACSTNKSYSLYKDTGGFVKAMKRIYTAKMCGYCDRTGEGRHIWKEKTFLRKMKKRVDT